MKANPKWKTIPVIILSNLGQESDAQKGLALGAVEYLVKADTKINTIIEKVRNYLK
jgi:DNA-binding response OmpR family regulator